MGGACISDHLDLGETPQKCRNSRATLAFPCCHSLASREYDSELVTGEKFGPQLQATGVVHGEYVHGGATDGRNPHDAHATEQESALTHRSRLGWKRGTSSAAQGIHPREIGALVKITAVAGQREILDLIAPAVLFGDDVLDVMR